MTESLLEKTKRMIDDLKQGKFIEGMEEFYADSDNGRPKLIEIFTPSESNDKVLKQFFNFIKL